MKTSVVNRAVAACSVVVALGCPAAALAVERVVPTAYDTIQAAVDAAVPGDVVKVLAGKGSGDAGVYPENVVIDKDITLRCWGPAVIDASTARTTIDSVDFSAGITILGPGGNGAAVEGCVVRFAKPCGPGTTPACANNEDEGDGIRVLEAENVAIRNCSLLSNAGSGLRVNANGFRVSTTKANGNYGYGFFVGAYDLGSDNGALLQNTARGNGASGIKVVGFGNIVDGNVVAAAGSECVEIDGNGNTVARNRVQTCGTDGIDLYGDSNIVRENSARDAKGSGIVAEGKGNLLTVNTVAGSGEHGFLVSDSGSGASLAQNVSQRNGGNGFMVRMHDAETAAPTFSARGNTARENTGDGFAFHSTANLVFRENLAILNGGPGVRETDSDFNLYNANRLESNQGDGFLFDGAGGTTVVSNNTVLTNLGDGIDFDRTYTDGSNGPVTVSGNLVQRNGGTGIENDKPETAINLNRVSGNRTDIAGAGDETPATGVVGSFIGNLFTTGGATTSTPGTGLNDPAP